MDGKKIMQAGSFVAGTVAAKNFEYGDAYPKISQCLKIMYPDGIDPSLYPYMPKITRTLEKLCRYAGGKVNNDIALDLAGIWLNQVIEDHDKGGRYGNQRKR